MVVVAKRTRKREREKERKREKKGKEKKKKKKKRKRKENKGVVDVPVASVEVLVVAVDPGVDGTGLALRLALEDGALALDDAGVGRLGGEARRDEDVDADAPVLELARRLDAGAARERRVVLQRHLGDLDAVVADDVLLVCVPPPPPPQQQQQPFRTGSSSIPTPVKRLQ